jgi:hypothetical protein
MTNAAPDLDTSTVPVGEQPVEAGGDITQLVLGFDLTRVADVRILPAGLYSFKIDAVERRESKKNPGNFYLNWTLSCLDDTMAEDLFHMMNLPGVNTDEKQKARQLRDMRDLVKAAGFEPSNTFRPADYIGCTVKAEVKVDNYEGRISNKVAKFVVG